MSLPELWKPTRKWECVKKSLETAAELHHYQVIKAVCEKWEVHKVHLLTELADVESELTKLHTLKANAATTTTSHNRRKYYELKETLESKSDHEHPKFEIQFSDVS